MRPLHLNWSLVEKPIVMVLNEGLATHNGFNEAGSRHSDCPSRTDRDSNTQRNEKGRRNSLLR